MHLLMETVRKRTGAKQGRSAMMQWSYDTLLKWGTDELTAHDVENASLDAWYLLEHIYGIQSSGFPKKK